MRQPHPSPQMMEKDEVFSKFEALASSCHILPTSSAFEDHHGHRYKFVRKPHAHNEAFVQQV